MFQLKYFSYFILLHLILATPQFNLYHTDWVSQRESESDDALQHTCLYVTTYQIKSWGRFVKVPFCMSELPSKFNVSNNDNFPTFTFAQLSKQNITSQQLYFWSAPIDLIEHYQFYLNQLSITNNYSSLASEVFHNCTIPRFGPLCQYEFDYFNLQYSYISLYDLIRYIYGNYEYDATNLTCYTHLKCNRGPLPACLHWDEICDGKVDCINDGVDEEYCWQLEINVCQDNEYQCRNGQCIPQSFNDDDISGDCSDMSDWSAPHDVHSPPTVSCGRYDAPFFNCEDLHSQIRTYHRHNINREALLMRAIYSNKNSQISEDCWSAFKCLPKFTEWEHSPCDYFCEHDTCLKIVQNDCPEIVYFPNGPVLFGNMYVTYKKNDLQKGSDSSKIPFYICYTTSQYDAFFINNTKTFLNNMTCIHSESDVPSRYVSFSPIQKLYDYNVYDLSHSIKRYLPFHYDSEICNRSNMYQCAHSSKCISPFRLLDYFYDCPYNDDEDITVMNNTHLQEYFNKNYFKCPISGKYIHQSRLDNGRCECEYIEYSWCEDEDNDISYLKQHIVFQHICDGFVDKFPIIINGKNETDETECEQWECNNIYTRCNGVWNCLNGVDESGCTSNPTLNCTSKQHLCVSPNTNQFICLSIDKASDGNIDCLGATDEPKLCGQWRQIIPRETTFDSPFYCVNRSSKLCISNDKQCDGVERCENGDDEQFCTNQTLENKRNNNYAQLISGRSDVEKFLYDYRVPARMWKHIHFRFNGMFEIFDNPTKNIDNTIFSSISTTQVSRQHQSRCQRGLDLRVWLNNEKNLTNATCFCPPSYYGDQCQYHNQRISLSIKFRALSGSWQTLFAIIISLIDDTDQRIIHSYEQISFLSTRDCQIKYHIYLLYSTRPKHSRRNYAIHIDFYENEKVPVTYRGSILLPVKFSFLPVHHIAFFVDIPSRYENNLRNCSNDECIYGQCIKYSNNSQNLTFCQCDSGWSGKYCNIQHTCTCSSDSLCIGISPNNQSICVCPVNKFGPRCFLTDSTCESKNNDTCQHGGQCISNINHITSNRQFSCICPKGYSGDRCGMIDKQLTFSFNKDLVLSQSIFIHFIRCYVNRPAESGEYMARTSTFRSIPRRQDSLTIYWSQPFHIVFIELFDIKTYYLTVFQKTYNGSAAISNTINPSDRCPNISELFNETFLQWNPIRRIKYYHLPCQNPSLNLSCFHDNVHFCLCEDFENQRRANCFEFNHHMTADCFGQNECENGGRCLQDKPDCPTASICICEPCFYGSRCQFHTRGFGLSLDAILGYHIIPNRDLTQQSFIIKMSIALTIIFMVAGFINGILSLITFKNKIVREVGCGLYLLGSSITTLLTMTMFGLKFFILLLVQMSVITNTRFLQFQCHSFDFLLRVFLCMDQWLNACVTIERTITVIKAIGFDKKKSKRAAKIVIISLLIFIIVTSIHDAIYRSLVNEENDSDDVKRIWCIVKYPLGLEVYNYIIHSFHFFGPFLVNLVSVIIFVSKKSRQQATIHTHQSYRTILREQLRQHKHLLTAPIILIILALPRLIITFTSRCMKSTNDVWLYLIGYFISFIPPMLTFVVFIMPSKFYKKEFGKTVAQYRVNIQRRLHIISQR